MVTKDHPMVLETDKFFKSLERSYEHASTFIDDELLNLLGCPHIYKSAGTGEPLVWNIVHDYPEETLTAVQVCLPRLIGPFCRKIQSESLLAILAGLHRYDCWRACLSTEEGADALASALVLCVASYEPGGMLDEAVAGDVIAILNAWLSPTHPWDKMPEDVVLVCEKLFGVAWCSLSLSNATRDLVGVEIAYVVCKQAPQLMPGLCQAQNNSAPMLLPADLGASL
jgi:hypothetical protein